MARILDRQRVLEMRLKGLSYSQIKASLQISKSTLSLWLKDYPLSRDQINNLRANNLRRIEKFRETMRLKREKRLRETYKLQQRYLLPLSRRELFISGLFLYWGEGSKTTNQININNTDPQMLKFALFWLNKILLVPTSKIKVYLHLYADMDIKKETLYWSKVLNMNRSNFLKPYIKESLRSNLTHKGFGHGTCCLMINNVILKEKIMMSISAIADYYSEKK